jgi:hypothetical protein
MFIADGRKDYPSSVRSDIRADAAPLELSGITDGRSYKHPAPLGLATKASLRNDIQLNNHGGNNESQSVCYRFDLCRAEF